MTVEKVYANKFTLDGRLKPGAGVSKRKVAAIKELFEAGLQGDAIKGAMFTESISTSDAMFNAAYLMNLQVLPEFDQTPRTWTEIAGVRVLPDFRPVVLHGMFGGFEGLERDDDGSNNPAGIAPVVPENSEYPYATLGDVEAAYGRLKKHGFKVGWTWEARVNDGIGFFEQIPAEMINTALDTEEWEVYQALINGTNAASQLDGGTIYTGDTVPANAPFSRNALIRAIFERSQRQVNGRYVQVTGGSNLIVPIGAGPAVSFQLAQAIIELQDGSLTLSASDVSNGLGAVTVVESEYVTGTNWYLVPKPGAVRRPVLELGRLRGHEAPELRVNNLTGNFVGGASVPPFEGSFDNDTIDMRLRYPLTGVLWAENYIVWSNGTGTA